MQLVNAILPYLVYFGLFAGVILVIKDIVRRFKGLP